jgi:hypothetical protein
MVEAIVMVAAYLGSMAIGAAVAKGWYAWRRHRKVQPDPYYAELRRRAAEHGKAKGDPE